MANWTHEWFFIVGALILVIALYVKRDKLKSLLGGGGKTPGGPGKRQS